MYLRGLGARKDHADQSLTNTKAGECLCRLSTSSIRTVRPLSRKRSPADVPDDQTCARIPDNLTHVCRQNRSSFRVQAIESRCWLHLALQINNTKPFIVVTISRFPDRRILFPLLFPRFAGGVVSQLSLDAYGLQIAPEVIKRLHRFVTAPTRLPGPGYFVRT